jgi:hypothetical protein
LSPRLEMTSSVCAKAAWVSKPLSKAIADLVIPRYSHPSDLPARVT